MKVKCYYNLTKKCFSIQRKGKVIAYAQNVALSDVTFKINENGRQRVIQERRKNVHAYVVGNLLGMEEIDTGSLTTDVTYNPYKYDSFVVKATEQPVKQAKVALLTNKQIKI